MKFMKVSTVVKKARASPLPMESMCGTASRKNSQGVCSPGSGLATIETIMTTPTTGTVIAARLRPFVGLIDFLPVLASES